MLFDRVVHQGRHGDGGNAQMRARVSVAAGNSEQPHGPQLPGTLLSTIPLQQRAGQDPGSVHSFVETEEHDDVSESTGLPMAAINACYTMLHPSHQSQPNPTPMEAPPDSSPHAQLSQYTTLLISASSILKQAASRWSSFCFIELWRQGQNNDLMVFDADCCIINGAAQQDSNQVAQKLALFREASKTFIFQRNQGIPGRAWQSMQPELHSDVQSLSQEVFHRKVVSIVAGLRGVVAWPVIAEGSLLGVLCAFSHQQLEGTSPTEFKDASQLQQVSHLVAECMR